MIAYDSTSRYANGVVTVSAVGDGETKQLSFDLACFPFNVDFNRSSPIGIGNYNDGGLGGSAALFGTRVVISWAVAPPATALTATFTIQFYT